MKSIEEMKSFFLLQYPSVIDLWEAYGSFQFSSSIEEQAFEELIATDAHCSLSYAFVHKKRFELGEPAISKHAARSYWYATDVLNGRFELGEPVIAKSAQNSYNYARHVLKGRFELGEEAIAKDAAYSYEYAKYILKGRFELGEPVMAIHPEFFYFYAMMNNCRFPMAEEFYLNLDPGDPRKKYNGFWENYCKEFKIKWNK